MGLNQVHIVTVPSTGRSTRSLDIVLTTAIGRGQRILGAIDLAGDLDISIAAGKVGRLDESLGEGLGPGGVGGRGGTEGNGVVFAGGNVTSGLRGHHHAPVCGGGNLDSLAAGGGCGRDHGKGDDGQSRCDGCDVEDHCFW